MRRWKFFICIKEFFYFFFYYHVLVLNVNCQYSPSRTSYAALLNVTYKDQQTGQEQHLRIVGKYGSNSKIESAWGWVVHPLTKEGLYDGCTPIRHKPNKRWIALLKRGNCKFTKKIQNVAVEMNASAVVIYNHRDEQHLPTIEHKVMNVVSLFIYRHDGQRLADLVDAGVEVMVRISVGKQDHVQLVTINKTSKMLVYLAFIIAGLVVFTGVLVCCIRRCMKARRQEEEQQMSKR